MRSPPDKPNGFFFHLRPGITSPPQPLSSSLAGLGSLSDLEKRRSFRRTSLLFFKLQTQVSAPSCQMDLCRSPNTIEKISFARVRRCLFFFRVLLPPPQELPAGGRYPRRSLRFPLSLFFVMCPGCDFSLPELAIAVAGPSDGR